VLSAVCLSTWSRNYFSGI